MKKFTLFCLILALAVAAFPVSTSAEPIPSQSTISISILSPKDNAELVGIRNYGNDIAVDELTFEFFNTSDVASASNNIILKNGIFSGNSEILLSQSDMLSVAPDILYPTSTNRIPASSGRIKIHLNGSLVDEVCWGSGKSCDNHFSAMSNDETRINPCFLNQNWNESSCRSGMVIVSPSPQPRSGGWLANPELCQYNPEILATDPLCVKPAEPNPPPPTDHCADLKISEIGANLDAQFIEVANFTASPLDIAGCIIQTNRNTKQFIFPAEILPSGAVRLVGIFDTELTLSKTVSGIVYILSPDKTENSAVTYPVPKAGTSWSLFSGEWKQVSAPSPGQPNLPEIVNLCGGVKLSEVGANLDAQFIEIMNSTDSPIDLSDCRLTTNRNTKFFAFSQQTVLPAGGYLTIYIKDTKLSLTKTTTGTVFLLSSGGQTELDSVSYANLSAGTSWSLVDGEWRQTYAPTPDAANLWLAYPLCEEGYERNLETGRCRKIPTENALTPCQEGQFRNPETGRCKKIDSDKTPTPCKEGQERNPETNRCRKIPTADEPKPCAEGYERNPETNRCRKTVENGAAAFAIDNSGKGGGAGGLWKWGAAGALLGMIGVVAWQYRAEVGRLFGALGEKLRHKQRVEIPAETT